MSKMIQPKRGYLANILTIPPLIYPFQFNPTEISDSKQIKWGEKNPIHPENLCGLISSYRALQARAIGRSFEQLKESLGRIFSGAKLRQFGEEGDRTLNFKFVIDGRVKQPDEPERRREDGNILGDLAIIRSFAYPKIVDLMGILAATFSEDTNWTDIWFNEPPTIFLVMGEMSVEGYITDLKIKETMFSEELDPVRAEVEITMIERIDSLSFIIDSVKRLGRTFYYTAYEDIG